MYDSILNNANKSGYRKIMERSFVATPISLLHILYQILLTKSLGLGLTVGSKTVRFERKGNY